MKVRFEGRLFDLGPVHEALKWAFDLMQGMDVTNAAKNCQEMRESPITTLLEQAVSVLDEMEAMRTDVTGGGWGGEHNLQQG